MTLIAYAHALVARRLRELNSIEERDRGDNPVPTVIIIVGLAILAGLVLTWASGLVDEFMLDSGDIVELPGGGAGA